MFRSKTDWHCIFSMGLFFVLNNPLSSHPFDWQARLDLSFIHDSNVLESIYDQQSGNSARILVNMECTKHFTNHDQFHMVYRGGLEGYQALSPENRIIQHLSLIYAYKLTRHATIGLEPQVRWRTFFQSDRGYQWQKIDAFAQINLPWGFGIKVYTSLSKMDASGQHFDYNSRSDGFKIMWRKSNKLLLYTGYSSELMNNKEFAYSYMTNYPFLYPEDNKQKNLLQETMFGIEWMGWVLCRLELCYQTQFSNSYGYDFKKPEAELILVKSLPSHLSFRAYGRYQLKDYLDDLTSLIQIHPDTETEQSRYLLCDLIKDLNKNQSMRLRVGWYQNESPFRNLYYKKTVISIGMSQSW